APVAPVPATRLLRPCPAVPHAAVQLPLGCPSGPCLERNSPLDAAAAIDAVRLFSRSHPAGYGSQSIGRGPLATDPAWAAGIPHDGVLPGDSSGGSDCSCRPALDRWKIALTGAQLART